MGDNKGFTGVMLISPGLFDNDSATEFSLSDSTNVWNAFETLDFGRMIVQQLNLKRELLIIRSEPFSCWTCPACGLVQWKLWK